MQKSGIISMESLFEIKAPLATFDTVDLGDEDKIDPSVEFMPVTPEESLAESLDSQSSNTSHNDSEAKNEHSSVIDAAEGGENVLSSKLQHHTDETDSVKGENTGTAGSAETNSSENSAAGAGDILQRLKLKSKKHKETESKVKYQQIENSSDLSDHEKSPLSDLKLASAYKICDSDTDSSDSDIGYIRTGYITALKGAKKGSKKKIKKTAKIKEKYSLSTPDSTPNASPKIFRPILPPPLTEAERAQQSKRKAYEKRLQRLQVTTAPIERPRSTTPIDIFGLDEYAYISSPEKTPQNCNFEKLKITLPPDEFHLKGQSPRKSARPTESHDPHVFTFNEDLLFTHTKSALVVQDDTITGHSPKKILIPPTLSPALSPRSQRCSTALNLSPRSPRYYYTPSKCRPETVASPNHVGDNWTKFEEEVIRDNAELMSKETKKQELPVNNAPSLKENISTDSFDLVAKDKVLNDEEILTVNIEVVNETKVCDIKCEAVANTEVNNKVNTPKQNQNISYDITSSDIQSEHKNKVPVFTNLDKNDVIEIKTSSKDADEVIWMAHESTAENRTKSEANLNSNTESNIGETLKEILDNAFKEEAFELELDEKESVCDTGLNKTEMIDTADGKVVDVAEHIDKLSYQW